MPSELSMTIQPKIISHLGINLYTSLPAVISEMIANSWDACSPTVHITAASGEITPDYEIIIKDLGNGMSFEQLNDMYLQVGRDRRVDDGDEICNGDRKVLGRKGIGKFSVFGVAETVSIHSVHDGKSTKFEMNVEKIKNTENDVYKPDIIENDVDTDDPNGVTIVLKNLKRTKAINIDELKSGIASRFMLFNDSFQVYLNDELITIEDRNMGDIEFTWDIDEDIDGHADWHVNGTIWAKKGTIREEYNRGITVFARGRLIQEPSFFGATSGKEFAYSHLFGQLTADFLDDEHDNTSTNRASINFESEEGLSFRDWAHEKITEMSEKWAEGRIAKRTNTITENEEVKTWMKGLTKTERKSAKSILNSIVKNDNLSDEQALDLFSYVKDTFSYRAFQDLADQIDAHGPDDAPLIIDLFKQWEHLESREMYKIMKGRISAIKKLREFIDDGSSEREVQKYLKQFPWVLNPKWTIVEEEATYSKLLREYFTEDEVPEENKRLDFLCFSSWGEFIILELKKPSAVIGVKEINQLRDYVIFIKDKIKTSGLFADSPVYGYLICEKIQKLAPIDTIIEDMKGSGRYVLKYTDLASYAEKLHAEFIEKYDELQKLTQPDDD